MFSRRLASEPGTMLSHLTASCGCQCVSSVRVSILLVESMKDLWVDGEHARGVKFDQIGT